MAFVVHNVTSHRVALKLHPAKAAAEGSPAWQARRFLRQNTFHVVVEPHLTVDLMSFGYTEKELLAQPEVLEYVRRGYLRRVREEGGGYVQQQFKPRAPIHPEATVELEEPVADAQKVEEAPEEPLLGMGSEEALEELQEAKAAPEALPPMEPPATLPKPASAKVRKPFVRPKKG